MKKLKVMRSWKTLTLLLIVVPMGLLATFRLIGILSEPQGSITIAETITLETVKGEYERPYYIIPFEEKLQSSYDGDVSMVQIVRIDHYWPDDWVEYGGSDWVNLILNLTSSVQVGHISNVRLALNENYEDARMNFFEEHQLIQLKNLSVTNLRDWARNVSIDLAGVNRPNEIYFWAPVRWVLRSPNNQTHRLDIVSEVVYFNGTAYKKVVQPFQLKIVADDNDSFETAREINEGYYPKLYIGTGGDEKDYYKIYATQGQRIEVNVNATSNPPAQPLLRLYLYDPERNLVVAKEQEDYVQTIDFVANSTGFWFIEVRIHSAYGFYSIGANK